MKKWIFIAGGIIIFVWFMTARSGSGQTGKKALFWTGAAGVLLLKIFGTISAAVAWPFLILFAVAGVITDATPTGTD